MSRISSSVYLASAEFWSRRAFLALICARNREEVPKDACRGAQAQSAPVEREMASSISSIITHHHVCHPNLSFLFGLEIFPVTHSMPQQVEKEKIHQTRSELGERFHFCATLPRRVPSSFGSTTERPWWNSTNLLSHDCRLLSSLLYARLRRSSHIELSYHD
jgi:hypothetical protein